MYIIKIFLTYLAHTSSVYSLSQGNIVSVVVFIYI